MEKCHIRNNQNKKVQKGWFLDQSRHVSCSFQENPKSLAVGNFVTENLPQRMCNLQEGSGHECPKDDSTGESMPCTADL